jgi:hypothetical protein
MLNGIGLANAVVPPIASVKQIAIEPKCLTLRTQERI